VAAGWVVDGAVQDEGDTADTSTWYNATRVVYWPEGTYAAIAVYKGTQDYPDKLTYILGDNSYYYSFSTWHSVSGYIAPIDYNTSSLFSNFPGGALKSFVVSSGVTVSLDNIASGHYDVVTDATVDTCK
jgi:hypothetical protein